jgi:hypothetical protein
MWDRKNFVRFVGGTPDDPKLPHFWTFRPLFSHFPTYYPNQDPPHLKANASKYLTQKKSTRYLKTRRHSAAPNSKNPVHSKIRPKTYIRAGARKFGGGRFSKRKFFQNSSFHYTTLRYKNNLKKKFSQLVEASPTVENFFKYPTRLREKVEKIGYRGRQNEKVQLVITFKLLDQK